MTITKPFHFFRRLLEKAIDRLLPVRTRLPARYWVSWLFGAVEVETRYLAQLPHRPGIAVDIGANEGFYSYRLAKIFEHVYAFEINPELGGDLVAYASPRITCIFEGLSSEAGEKVLFIPRFGEVLSPGWGSFIRYADATEIIEREVFVRTLDEFELTCVALIKVDVEGHELEVLRGADATIERDRPLIIIETWDDQHAQIVAHLKQRGYRRETLQSLTGVQGTRYVFIFVPD